MKNERALKSSRELSFPTMASSDGELPRDDEIINRLKAVHVFEKVIEDNGRTLAKVAHEVEVGRKSVTKDIFKVCVVMKRE